MIGWRWRHHESGAVGEPCIDHAVGSKVEDSEEIDRLALERGFICRCTFQHNRFRAEGHAKGFHFPFCRGQDREAGGSGVEESAPGSNAWRAVFLEDVGVADACRADGEHGQAGRSVLLA